ncbi:hypothetical protein JG30_00670 [Bombilactobacillus mellifer]|uniref:SpaA-like prealbumin fold domain-containing protein n=1 Tax=Bombilactobacillus mellifer TaxID=1218492 RepID=A0A0F4LX35_9LACO|nr:prealbumin-like fold domain-containing protein [Bombilactobacillus mellifer]KJY63160.1 hypothetical protein JG30_00670 [Bombilactobacillus mellifer]
MKKSRLWSLIIQVILTLILMVGQLPLSAWADTGSTPTPGPKLVTPAKAKNKQATFQQGVIQSPQAQDNRYQITTNLAAFQQTPNLQAVTIQIQPQAQKIVAHTKWILQVPVLAVDLTQLSKELPAGLQLTKDDEHGIVTVKADHDLKLKRQQNVQLNFPVRAVAGEFPFYLAMVYGQTQTTLPTTSLGTLKLSGLLAHYQPQTQTRSLEKVLGHPVATPAKTRSISPEHAKPSSPATHSSNSATPAPARQVKSEYHAPTKSQTRKPQPFSQTPTTAEPTTNTAKVIQQLAHKPQLKSTATASTNTTPPANAFNSSIAQRSDTPPAAINNSDQGIKIHAENTQTHELVQKLNDDSISTQDVTPEFAAYFDGEGMDNPDTTPTATVRVDAHGNGTLNVKQSGWYILHQTNNYQINSGWTYLVLNIDGSYTHSTMANYYAAYYDADKNQVTQAMSGGSQFLLPVYASDVTEYLKYMNDYFSSSIYYSWSQAWNYIQKNGGDVTFYGTGDLTKQLGQYEGTTYKYMGLNSFAYDSKHKTQYWNYVPEDQRYKYGLWLRNAMQYSKVLKHPLPQNIDVTQTPLALSTTKPALQKITTTSCNSADTSVQWTSDLVTLGSRKMQRVNISTQDRTTQKTLPASQYNVFFAGVEGNGNDGTLGVTLQKQRDMVNQLTGKLYLSNFNRDGWYILQQKDVTNNETDNETDYQVNGSYYAVKFSVLKGITEYFRVSQQYGDQIPLPPFVSDVTEYLKYMNDYFSSSIYYSWSQAWNYIQKNGGDVTFYGTGDLTKQLGQYEGTTYKYMGLNSFAYDSKHKTQYWNYVPEDQRYKYGLWLRNAMQYSKVLKHPLPQAIKVDETPLDLSTKNQEYLDLAPDQPAYNQGLTTADGFLTGQNGALNFRDKFIGIQKVDQDDNHQTLSGATFKVFDSGLDGKQTPQSNPKVSKSTDSHGITQMPVAGGDWYIIQEQGPPEGYSQNPNYYALKIDATDGIVAMMKDYSPTLQPVFKSSGQSNYGTELSLAPDTPAYKQPALTTDGFLIAQAGHLIFQDKFTGLAKLDYYDSTVPVSDAQFHLWYTGIDGDQAPVVVDNHSRIPTDSGYDETQTTFTTQGKGLLKLNMTATGWYVLAEGEPAPGYRDHQGFYYAFHWSGGSGVDQFCQGHELHLVQPFASDVTEYLKYMNDYFSSSIYYSWSQAWNYIQKNGGGVTFYGTGDLTKQLGQYEGTTYKYMGLNSFAYDSKHKTQYWNYVPEDQRYKYGLWLRNAMQYSKVLRHPLPQTIKLDKTPLALSTKSHSIVQLPYADKQNYNAPYRKGVTSFDGFLTAKNGALYMRNVPVTYLTLDEDNPLVIRRSDLGKVSWRGTWHDLYCQPNNQQTAKVSLQIDDQKAADITQPTTARIVGTDEFGQNDFSVQFLNDTSAPTAIDATHGSAGLITANHDTALGEHTLTFQAHGSVDSAVIKKKLIVVPDNYPYGAQITKDFTVNQKNKHQTQAVLSDLQHGTGDLVTVYTHLKNTGDPLHAGKITTQIPSQFNYLGPTQGTIELTTQTQEKVSAAVTFDGTNLTVTLPDPLPQNSEYTLQYDLQQIAPMPLSYPGPSGGAQAQDHFSADSGNTEYPYYGTNSNTVHWYSNQALWVQLLRVPPLDFGTKLLIKDYKNAFFNNTATTEDATQNVLQLKDRGYNQQNTWQLTANLSAFSNLQDPTATLPDAYIHYGNDQTFNQPANTTFNKDIYPNQPPVVLLERTSGKLPGGADIIQQLKQVRLQLGSQDPKPGSYRATMTYTLTQSLQ